jgi:hypothetical protein
MSAPSVGIWPGRTTTTSSVVAENVRNCGRLTFGEVDERQVRHFLRFWLIQDTASRPTTPLLKP